MSKSYDLSTSTKWANLADGEHVVKLKSKGAGYGTSSFSNSVTVTKGSAMPVKGDLITIESKQYRVLKTSGSVAEVLAMYDANLIEFDASRTKNVYKDNTLDIYLSQTFYNSLSTAMQNAITIKTFMQDAWSWNNDGSAIASYNGTYGETNYLICLISSNYGSSISRNCYVLSCQDVIDYLEVTESMTSSDTTLTSENLFMMFWNQATPTDPKEPWLRSASSSSKLNASYIHRLLGRLDSTTVNQSLAVRPAFQIDLSKIEWSPVGG